MARVFSEETLKAFNSGSYDEALNIIGEYVRIVWE